MVGIEKYTKDEQINWYVSVQACSSKNPGEIVFLPPPPPPQPPIAAIQILSHFLPKLSSTYDMLPKNHMKYPLHHLYKFPGQG